jgi:hypothetical protein
VVKTILSVLFVLLITVPALAQDDYPRVDMSLGYANLGLTIPVQIAAFPAPVTVNITDGHHSGFATEQGFNLTPWFGIDNYFAYYSLGTSPVLGTGLNLISNTIGGRVMARRFERIVPYAVAGFGIGYLTSSSTGGGDTAMGARFGGGVDLPFSDSLGLRVDATRMSYHFFSTWNSGWNISTGVVLTILR